MTHVDETLDLRGLNCPLPVLKTQRRLRDFTSGTIIRVETTDPLAVIDVPHFCSENGHALLETETLEDGHAFIIQKG